VSVPARQCRVFAPPLDWRFAPCEKPAVVWRPKCGYRALVPARRGASRATAHRLALSRSTRRSLLGLQVPPLRRVPVSTKLVPGVGGGRDAACEPVPFSQRDDSAANRRERTNSVARVDRTRLRLSSRRAEESETVPEQRSRSPVSIRSDVGSGAVFHTAFALPAWEAGLPPATTPQRRALRNVNMSSSPGRTTGVCSSNRLGCPARRSGTGSGSSRAATAPTGESERPKTQGRGE